VPVIGRLGGISPGANPDSEVAFRQGLSETGFVEGRNVVVEYRWGADAEASVLPGGYVHPEERCEDQRDFKRSHW
jgi:putative tryptophan/tyrosine transport system substrate-binding protein